MTFGEFRSFFQCLADLDMRNAATVAQLDDLFRKQSEATTRVSLWRFAAGQRGDLDALRSGDLNRTARTRRIFQALKARLCPF